jgi:hypothetical protein
MAVPLNASAWTQPFDPWDRKEYVAEFDTGAAGASGPVLEENEEIVSYAIEVSAEAAALGVEISEAAGYEDELLTGNKQIQLWFEVDEAFREDAAFSGAGTDVGVEFTIITNSNPPRRHQKTYVLRVAQQ